MKILITGVPATGKTTLGKKLAEKLKFRYYNEKDILKKSDYDIVKEGNEKVKEIDIFALEKRINALKGDFIIEGLVVPETNIFFDYCFVLYENPDILRKRMKNRGYSDLKIEENIFVQEINYFLDKIKAKNIFLIQRSDIADIDLMFKLLRI